MTDAGADRRPWIALASDPPVAALLDAISDDRLQVTRDPRLFNEWLTRERPRVVIVAEPPARDMDLAAVLRERRRRPRSRVVHLSAPDAVDARLSALRAGVDDAVPHDISGPELYGRLIILDERAQERADGTVVVADGVTLDAVAHEVRRHGSLVHLRPKEFQLLAMLAAHAGRAYTRRQILDRVWGHDHEGDPRTVDVHVRWLRAKVEPDPAHPVHLVTVRGVGYRLDPEPR